MKKLYLCGHTGSLNRGCEAIVRSTCKILNKSGVTDINAFTFDYAADKKLGLCDELKMLPYGKKSIISKALTLIEYFLFGTKEKGAEFYYKDLFKNESEFIVFNIGGDTYCYSTPYMSYALNNLSKKNNITNIFWGCSVGESALADKKMQEDLNKYDYIIVRESLTEEIVKKLVKDNSKIYRACDPAFQLQSQIVELPNNFIKGNTVGLNLSGFVFGDENNEKDIMYDNLYYLIDYILDNTDMNICLIPHVYSTVGDSHDYIVLSKIYNKYKETSRVSIVDKELSCTQLKYIISKCRFFVGARTHATIAAYSTGVPAIALSYSIKSRGIAKDLFGTEEGYVIRWQDIKEENVLKDTFINTLLNNEKTIREVYDRIMPEYKNSILEVTKEVLNKVGV